MNIIAVVAALAIGILGQMGIAAIAAPIEDDSSHMAIRGVPSQEDSSRALAKNKKLELQMRWDKYGDGPWCMYVRGNVKEGMGIFIDYCSKDPDQEFVIIGKTLRPAEDTSLCVGVPRVGSSVFLRLYKCKDGDENQEWDGLRSNGCFEIHPSKSGRLLATPRHQPRHTEEVRLQTVAKPRKNKTNMWCPKRR